MKYLVKDATGRILRHGTCSAATFDHLARPGETAVALPDDHPAIDDAIHHMPGDTVVAKPVDEAERVHHLRRRRNQLLARSDWTQLPDAPFTPEQRAKIMAYRQALRDFPAQPAGTPWPKWPL